MSQSKDTPRSRRAKQTQNENQEKASLIDELHSNIERCDAIVQGLSNVGAWDLVLEDTQKEIDKLNNNWQYVSDEKLWYEYKITKLALNRICNLIEQYENEKEHYQKELSDLIDVDKKIVKDYDSETVTSGNGNVSEFES